MRIDVLTLFPEMFEGVFDYSIIGKARERGLIDVKLHDIRSYTHDKHNVADDYPYGGGAGMVLKPEPVFEAVESVRNESGLSSVFTILLSPQGRLFDQAIALELASYEQLIIVCGHYEGVDERVAEHLVDAEISIGDFLLSGGEIAAMVVIDCLVRLLPGAIGSDASLIEESHVDGLLEYPQYTRPEMFRNWAVPPILLSGNHAEIARWRRQQSLLRTAKRRADLLERAELSDIDRKLLDEALSS